MGDVHQWFWKQIQLLSFFFSSLYILLGTNEYGCRIGSAFCCYRREIYFILELPRWWCSNSRSENSSSSRDPCVCMCVTTSLSTCHRRERWDGKWRVGTRDPTNNTNWCAISPIGCCKNQWKNLRESLSLSLKKPISSSFLFFYSFASLPSFFFKLFFILEYMI